MIFTHLNPGLSTRPRFDGRIVIRFFNALFLGALAVSAQPPTGASEVTLHGQIQGGQSGLGNLMIELRAVAGHAVDRRAYATSLGDFQIPDVPAGDYQLVVRNHQGDMIKQDFVHVDRSNDHLDILLPSAGGPSPPSGSVSLASLSHKVPGKARRELRTAAEARRRGDTAASVAHVRKALEVDPEFAEAHNDLGSEFVDRKLYPEALAEFDRAAQLDPASVIVAMNRAVCLSNLGRLEEAETVARRAVRLDAASPRARYILGVVLAAEKKFAPETTDNLLLASEAIPRARVLAARILLYSGRAADAREQLRLYLANCSGSDCGPVQDWLRRLENP